MGFQSVSHFLIAAHFWFGCYYDWNYVKLPVEITGEDVLNTKKLKFLTYWDALLQSVFFTICFLNDIIGTNEKSPKTKPLIRKLKDLILPTLAFPLAMFVGLTFWGLYAIDRELIFPEILDTYFPMWLNHLMHTNIMLFTLLELLTSYRKYPSRKVGLSILVGFMLTYLVWIHYLYAHTNKWVYPVLNVLNLPGRIIFFVSNLAITIAVYVLGEKINSIRWDRHDNTKTKSKKQKSK